MQDSSQEADHGQRPPKMRSKTAPEGPKKARRCLRLLLAGSAVGSFWAGWAPKVL